MGPQAAPYPDVASLRQSGDGRVRAATARATIGAMRTARLHTARFTLASTALAALASLTWSAAAAADTPVVLAAGDPTVDYVDETVEEASAWEVPGEVLVDAKDGLDAAELAKLATDYGVTFHATALAAETNEEVADVSPDREDALVDALRHDGRVEIAEPLLRMKALYVPNDPLMKDQWHLTRVGAERAWDFTTGRGVTVAVIDTGIACEDFGPFMKGSDLKNTECVAGWNFVAKNEHANDDHGHGTHVAGTIAQSTDNGIGVAGVAFGARLMPVKVLSAEGWGTTADIADGVRWAADHGAQVINMSLGGPRNSGVLQKAIDYAVSRGVVVVAAAGNSGGSVGYPGANEGVIGVSASDPDDKLAKFSSRGAAIDIAAPGVNVTQQTICNKGRDKCENFAAFNGTSMAAPHVAGAAALVVSLGVTEPAAVEDALKSSARVVDDSEAREEALRRRHPRRGRGRRARDGAARARAPPRARGPRAARVLVGEEGPQGRDEPVQARLHRAGARDRARALLLRAVDPPAREPRGRRDRAAARRPRSAPRRVAAPVPAARERGDPVRAHVAPLRREEAPPGRRRLRDGYGGVPRLGRRARRSGGPLRSPRDARVVRGQRPRVHVDREDEPGRD